VRGELIVHVIQATHVDMILDPAAEPLATHLSEVMQRLREE
jgi:hypothetical protein